MPTVLALDLATRSGFAVDGPKRNARGEPVPISGSFRAGPASTGPLDYGATYVQFRDWIVDLCAVHSPDHAIFEAPLPFSGGSNIKKSATPETVRKLLGFCAVAEETLARLGVKTYEANVQTVRKHFCGDSRAKKPDVMRVCRLMGWPFEDDNAADALALWDFARAGLKIGGTAGTLFGERRA